MTALSSSSRRQDGRADHRRLATSGETSPDPRGSGRVLGFDTNCAGPLVRTTSIGCDECAVLRRTAAHTRLMVALESGHLPTSVAVRVEALIARLRAVRTGRVALAAPRRRAANAFLTTTTARRYRPGRALRESRSGPHSSLLQTFSRRRVRWLSRRETDRPWVRGAPQPVADIRVPGRRHGRGSAVPSRARQRAR